MTRIWKALAAVLALALLATGCGSSDGDDDAADASPDAEADEPVRGGTLTYLHSGEAVSMDPRTVTTFGGFAAIGSRGIAVYDLLVYEDQSTGEVKPKLAKSLETTDGLTWTLQLRKGVVFSDGSPYDAAAVKFNIERYVDPALPPAPAKVQAEQIASTTVVDPETLRIVLKKRNASFDHTMARVFSMVASPKAVREKGASFGLNPVGAGPFVMKEWRQGDQMILERNPTYWDAPRPYLDSIVHKTVADATQRFNTVEVGQAHMWIAQPADGSVVVRAQKAGQQVSVTSPNGGSSFMLNTKRPPFDDVRIRQALAMGVDWEQGSIVTSEGQTEAVDTLFRKEDPYYTAKPLINDYQPKKAQQLIDDYVKETGRPVEFTVTGNVGASPPGAGSWDFVQAQMNQYDNVKVALSMTPSTGTAKGCAEHTLDAAPQANAFLDVLQLKETLYTGAPRNCGQYSNAELDQAFDSYEATTDTAAKKRAVATIQRIMVAEMPAVFYSRAYQGAIYDEKVRGVEQIAAFVPDWAQLWLSAS